MTPPAGDATSAPGIWQSISEIVRAVLESDCIDPAVDLFDQGATSLAVIRIVGQINESYDITVDVMELDEASIDCLSVLVTAQVNRVNQLAVRN
jgi:acyl carrier protein